MGQLIGLPSEYQPSSYNHFPKRLFDCIDDDGNVDIDKFLHYRAQQDDELDAMCTDLLFGLSTEATNDNVDEETSLGPRPKKRRGEKRVVTFIDPSDGERRRLMPKMSLW